MLVSFFLSIFYFFNIFIIINFYIVFNLLLTEMKMKIVQKIEKRINKMSIYYTRNLDLSTYFVFHIFLMFMAYYQRKYHSWLLSKEISFMIDIMHKISFISTVGCKSFLLRKLVVYVKIVVKSLWPINNWSD